MNTSKKNTMTLGINGLGRIGKLFLWSQIARKDFSEIVVNIGRKAGNSLQSIIDSVRYDSTYGRLDSYLFGNACTKEVSIRILDEDKGIVEINGLKITFLTEHRNPKDILWGNTSMVIDATGKFNDPTLAADHPQGSVRGHLLSKNVKKVIISSPFKLNTGEAMPDDVTTIVLGINDNYKPQKHKIISNASCTTTCLSHMLNPLLAKFGSQNLQSMIMRTVHAMTGKQVVLDRLPKEGETDPVKFRSTHNNIFLTTTGASETLKWVMPEIKDVPFSAIAIRVPNTTGSLLSLDLVWDRSESYRLQGLSSKDINQIYQDAAAANKRYLRFTEKQLVSTDIIGRPNAAAIIQGKQTTLISNPRLTTITTSIYSWYDNELSSYVNMLANQALTVADSIA